MNAVDLFAGLGGFSEGATQAGCRVVWAANHWQAAVDIHAQNHPDTSHACQDLHQQDWTKVPSHDLLLASWACQGFSRARGTDKPHHDAMRSTAWAVVSAIECHRPYAFIGENVPEFARWQLFPVWCSAMHALGYALTPMILDAADHGVPQHRLRLFIVGTRTKYPIELQLPRREHIPASSVVNFNVGKWSAVGKATRAHKTLLRIEAGRQAYGDQFVMPYYGGGSGLTGRSLHRPLGTVTTRDRWGLVDGDRMRMLTAEESRAFMGFPDTYKIPANHRLATFMLGNAVCPPVASNLIASLRKAA
jgi:DNA (cytosine-5)-methyltransferase 1